MNVHNRLSSPLFISGPLVALTVLLTSLTACGDSAAREEALRKEREALGKVDVSRADPASDRRTQLTFEAQPGWIVETPTSAMRKAQFRLPAAEGDLESPQVLVFLLTGSVEDNLKRWADQFDADPAEKEAALANVEVQEVANMRMHTFDMTGTILTDSSGNPINKEGWRMLSTVIESTDGGFPGGGKYFIKLFGPAKTIAQWESSYRDLLASL